MNSKKKKTRMSLEDALEDKERLDVLLEEQGIRGLKEQALLLPQIPVVVAYFTVAQRPSALTRVAIFFIGRDPLCDIRIKKDVHISRMQLCVIKTKTALHLFHTSQTAFNVVNQSTYLNLKRPHLKFEPNERVVVECGEKNRYRFIINPQICAFCDEPFGSRLMACGHPFCLTCTLKNRSCKCTLCPAEIDHFVSQPGGSA
jgi:hypothetical protein